MKTLFQPFFSRSTPSNGQTQEKKPSRQQLNSTRHRGPDKSAQAAGVQRGTAAFSPPQKPQTQTHQQQPCSDATSAAEQDPGRLLDRLIRRGTTKNASRNNATPRGQRQLTTVPDEGYEKGDESGHAGPSCSEIAPPHHHAPARGQNPDDAADAAPSALEKSQQQKTHHRFSRFHRSGAQEEEHSSMSTATRPAMLNLQPQQSTKLRPRSSFRDRFWTAHSANDFGDESQLPVSPRSLMSPMSPVKMTQSAPVAPAPAEAPSKPKAYVPRHAAADFSRTTIGSHHRKTSSWDGSKGTVRSQTPNQPTALPPPAHQANYTLDPRSVAEEENPFADTHEADDADELSEMDPSSRQHKRRSAPPLIDRASIASFTAGGEDWPPSDYERFLASARAQAVRRSWREGSKRDSAYYSGKPRGSPRTSSEGSHGHSSREAVPQLPKEALADAKRQSRVAQKIVEYIKPPREDAARMSSVRED